MLTGHTVGAPCAGFAAIDREFAMSPQPALKHRITVDDYLAGEKDGELRHEYIDGEVYAMTGASDRHALIVNALAFALTPAARQRRCQLFTNDMKVRFELAGATVFYYPDLLLACDPADRELYFRTAPCLVVEVLSPRTERIDRREKLFSYITLPSLQEYLLVGQDRPLIEIHRRSKGWTAEEFASGSLRLDCLDTDLSVADVYADVSFPA
jgi:Uma2 family endonuclease